MLKFIMLIALLCNTAFAKNAEITLTKNNSVVFNQPFTGLYVAKKIMEIFKKAPSSDKIYLVLDTPGGSVSDGLRFIDTIKALKIPVHTITLSAASMGYQVVQQLGTRYITASGTLMSHRGAISGLSGQVPGELDARLNLIHQVLSDMNKAAAKRIGIPLKDYEASIVNELWSFGAEAVRTGQADQVANVQCNKELIEEEIVEEVATPFGIINVVFSACPLLPAPIDIKFSREVKKENFSHARKFIEVRNKKVNLTF